MLNRLLPSRMLDTSAVVVGTGSLSGDLPTAMPLKMTPKPKTAPAAPLKKFFIPRG
jgi:hypothetical protein